MAEVHIGHFSQVIDHFPLYLFHIFIDISSGIVQIFYVGIKSHVPKEKRDEHVIIVPPVIQMKSFVDITEKGLLKGADDNESLFSILGDFLECFPPCSRHDTEN